MFRIATDVAIRFAARRADVRRMLVEIRRELLLEIQSRIRDVREEGSSTDHHAPHLGEPLEAEPDEDLAFALIQMKSEMLERVNEAVRTFDEVQRVSQHQLSWLRAHLYQPMDHHLSFRIGNQLFFVFVEASGGIPFDEQSRNLLLRVAQQANGAACLMPMRTHAGTPVPSVQGWGLIDAHTGEPVDPPSLVSSELIIMTDWELMDFAVQIVRDQAEQQGHEIASWQSNLEIDPSIWYVDGNDGVRGWIVIRGTRWPVLRPNRPSRAADLAQLLRGENREGYFAWVSAGNADEPGDPSSPTPLYRGHALEVRDYGIEEL